MADSRPDVTNRWLLPEGVDEFLPEQAEALEQLRRDLLDLFHAWGYELVMPPLIEYLESLQVGIGHDLDIETFKLIDQYTGRLMGVRADMTPQVARIDAHRLNREGPVRLCYMDTVLHTRQYGFAHSRTPIQLGAELYGHAGIESDIEMLRLMVEMLKVTGVNRLHIDLGHVGIFRSLARSAQLNDEQEAFLFDALQRKDRPEIESYLAQLDVDRKCRRYLVSLVELNGDHTVLDEAESCLAGAGADIDSALENLRRVERSARSQLPLMPLYFDLAELRGYRYQSGVVFAAFVPGHGHEVARGGRYDEIGRLFGRTRPATGFSSDLLTLLSLRGTRATGYSAIAAPASECEALQRFVRQLRGTGERVISELPGQNGDMRQTGCDRRIEKRDGQWVVVESE